MIKCLMFLTVLIFSETVTAQPDNALKAGDIVPNAKVIDADELFPFNHGVAIVKKGKASALINNKGEFVIPYSLDYDIQYVEGDEGLFPVKGKGSNLGYMNYQGKIFSAPGGWAMTEDKKYGSPGSGLYIDVNGKRYNVTGAYFQQVNEGLGISEENGFFGFKNVQNQFVVKPVYKTVLPFSDGAAIVSGLDEVGVMKYGFVDTNGKLIIPLMFSTMPRPFSDGLARVTPKDQNEFFYAFINKKGDVVIKLTLADVKKYGGGSSFDAFKNGYAYNGKYVMDKTGKVMLQTELLQMLGVTTDFPAIQHQIEMKDKIVFSQKGAVTNAAWGFIDLNTKKIVNAVFNNVPKHPLYFDPIHKLSYAEVVTGRDVNRRSILRQGYINEDGIFVIVKGESASKW